jgi:membrane associated rhomboid family serine protease
MVEEEYGTGWFLFTYVFTGICGFYLSYIFSPGVFTVGASASLFGLIGVGIGFAYRERERRDKQLKTLLQWAVFGIGIGFLDIIPMNNAAHIGGLIGGLGFGLLLSPREANQRGFYRHAGTVLGYFSVAVSFGGFALAIASSELTKALILG